MQHRGLAAKQMGAAGDIQKQAMRRIERDQRRETVAPVGDVAERPGVGRLIGVEHCQMRTDGAGIGERQADGKAVMRGSIVERIDLKRVVLPGNDDARHFIWRIIRHVVRAC